MIGNIQNTPYHRTSGDYSSSPGVPNPGNVNGQVQEQKAASAKSEAKSDFQNVESKPTQAAGSDISLKFQVDDQTNQITVLVLDRSTDKVIRTIPADEMNKLSSGELLSLFA
jgi:uncharacterized FlaG/YvyC family protein